MNIKRLTLALLFALSAHAAPTQKTWKGTNSTWDIGITANWLSNGVASTYANGDYVIFDDTATGYTVTGTNLQPGSVLFTNSAHNYTFSASTNTIGGATALTKSGTGTVTFNGTNTFSGGLNILNGTVAVGVALATNWLGTGTITLGDSSGANNAALSASVAGAGDLFGNAIVVAAGTTGTLSISAANAYLYFTGPLALNNNLLLNLGNTGKSATFSAMTTETSVNSPALTVAVTNGFAVFSGGVGVGSGGLTFAANSTAGTTTIGPGNVAGSGNLTFNVNNNNTLTVSAASINHSGNLTNSGAGIGATTISGNLGGNVASVVQNSATSALKLLGANSAYTNNVFVNAGTLTLSSATSLTAANLVTVSAGGILDVENSLTIAGLQDGTGAGVVTNASTTARTLTLGGAGTYSFSGSIGDGANGGAKPTTLVKTGAGTQTLSGVNTYSGSTIVSNGTLLVNGAIITNSVIVNAAATLGGNGTIGGPVSVAANGILSPSLGTGGASTLTLSSSATNALTLNGGNGNLVFAVSANATALTNDGIQIAGTLVLKGANTIALSFPGGTAPAGTYTLMTYAATNGTGTLALNAAYLNTTLAVTSTNVQLIVSSSTNGLLTWKGQNNGTWDKTTTNWVCGGSAINYTDGSQVAFDDTALLFAVANGGVSPASVSVNNSLSNYTFNSTGGGIGGSAGLTKYGTGTLTLNGANGFTGSTVINAGSVMVGNTSALAGSSVTVNVAGGLGFAVNAVTLGSLAGAGSFALNSGTFPVSLTLGGNNASTVYAGNLAGLGSLTKIGSGVLTLTGSNAIAGVTTVSNGTLAVSGPLAAGALNVFGSTLTGAGTISGPVTVGAGGTLSLSNNWIINGALNLGAGSTTSMQLGQGTSATLISGVGSLAYGGTLMVTCSGSPLLKAGSSFQLFDAATYSGAFVSSNLPALDAGLSWYLFDLTNCGTIRIVPPWSVASVFGDNMVLQRGIPVPVWGTANPGQSVTVTFGGQTKTTTAGVNRKWIVQLDTMAANTNSQSLSITMIGTTNVVYTNVLVGDVWLAGGQSNMDANVTPVSYVTNAAAEIAAANYPLIRSVKVAGSRYGSPVPVWDATIQIPWAACSPATVANWSGTAYFFARNLFQNTNVPIGILESDYGGTVGELWVSQSALNAVPELQTLVSSGCGLFNAMISPLIPFAIRGAIWYQGESNSGRGQQYRVLLPTLIQDWRSRWQQADYPFYIVQLAGYTDVNYPYIREAQMLTLQTATNTGLAVTIDVGTTATIHPLDKQDVGARLADVALNQNYGFTNVVPSGPIFQSYAIEGRQIRLYFDYAGGGLMTGQKNGLAPVQELAGVAPMWFEIAGADQNYYPATAFIDTNNTVVVSSSSVPNPTLARYAWSANPQGTNLYNRAGLPASPFRISAWTNSFPVASLRFNAGSLQSACAVPTNVTWWVEFNDRLAGTPWTPLVLPQTGTGSVQTVADPLNGCAQRFYRWCLMP